MKPEETTENSGVPGTTFLALQERVPKNQNFKHAPSFLTDRNFGVYMALRASIANILRRKRDMFQGRNTHQFAQLIAARYT